MVLLFIFHGPHSVRMVKKPRGFWSFLVRNSRGKSQSRVSADQNVCHSLLLGFLISKLMLNFGCMIFVLLFNLCCY